MTNCPWNYEVEIIFKENIVDFIIFDCVRESNPDFKVIYHKIKQVI